MPELKLGPRPGGGGASSPATRLEGRLVGILLHRLIEHLGLASHDRDSLATTAEALLRRDERLAASDLPQVVEAAVARYRDLAARPDLAGLFESARVWHEVPVALRDGDLVVHGAIDSLLVGEGRAWVLEFKSGRPDPSHERAGCTLCGGRQAAPAGHRGRGQAGLRAGFGPRERVRTE